MTEKLFFAAKALIVADGRFLAMKRAAVDSELLELPGGRMEYGETIRETLDRELMEETGLQVTVQRIIDTWDLIEPHRQISGVIFGCRLNEHAKPIQLSSEHSAYEWLGADEIHRLYPVFACKESAIKQYLSENNVSA